MARYVKWILVLFAGIWASLLGTTLGYAWNLTHPGVQREGGKMTDGRDLAREGGNTGETVPQYRAGKDENRSSGTEKKEKHGYWTAAVFGVDSREGILGKGTRSDMVMVCNINLDTGEIRLASVYRDTYLRTNREKNAYDKINQAYFFGGPKRSVEVLEDNLDLEVDVYAAFSWKAVVDAINLLGGIDVDISHGEYQVINGFITETVESTGVGSHQLKHEGANHLDGVQAVAYARLRKMDTDFKRTGRQRAVAELVLEKARTAELSVIRQLVMTVLPQISTDISVGDFLELAGQVRRFHLTETEGFPFVLKDAYVGKKDCVIPVTLEENVKRLHGFLFGDDGYTPSEEVIKISRQIEKNTMGRTGQ